MEIRTEHDHEIEKITDDGNYSIGYCDGKAIRWSDTSERPESFYKAAEDDEFGINCTGEYKVIDGEWVHSDDR